MSDETRDDAPGGEEELPEKPLERPTTDTKLISDMDVTDAAAAIRDALGAGPRLPAGVGSQAGEGRGSASALHDRLGSVEERLERLAELEDRFSRIEAAIDELKTKLDDKGE